MYKTFNYSSSLTIWSSSVTSISSAHSLYLLLLNLSTALTFIAKILLELFFSNLLHPLKLKAPCMVLSNSNFFKLTFIPQWTYFLLVRKIRLFSHEKVVITQSYACCWFYAPIYAKWLPLNQFGLLYKKCPTFLLICKNSKNFFSNFVYFRNKSTCFFVLFLDPWLAGFKLQLKHGSDRAYGYLVWEHGIERGDCKCGYCLFYLFFDKR